MNRESRALLLGMLLGDGCLKSKKHRKSDGTESTYYEYVICHSTKQEEYLQHKLELFHSIIGGKKPKINYETTKLGYDACRFSRCHKSFRILKKYLYSNEGKKYFCPRILNYLTPHSIAIWYMDDGCISRNKNKEGRITSCEMRIATYFSGEEADYVISYFKEKWDIDCKKRFYKPNGTWIIVFNTTSSKKLEELIGSYVHPSMKYKLPSKLIPRVPDPSDILEGDDIV